MYYCGHHSKKETAGAKHHSDTLKTAAFKPWAYISL